MGELTTFVFPVISFVICLLIFPLVIKIFKGLNWFDSPGSHKIHSNSVPSMGGVAILIGVMLSLLMGLPLQQWIERKYFFISVVLMFLIGVRDDVLALLPRQKLMSQLLPVFVLVFLGDARLFSFYEITGGQPWPSALSYFISLFTIVIITNAYNLIDGIDGLAGSVGAIVLTFFGIWFYEAGNPYHSLIAFCFAGALIAFLLFNWQPSSIFMGDTGALTIGLVLSYYAVAFINANAALPDGHEARFKASISTALCILIIPLFDTLQVILFRLSRWQSPFHADHNHIHHRFLQTGKSHAGAVRWIAAINVLFIGLALLLREQSDLVLMPLVVVLGLLLNFGLRRMQSR